MTQSPADNSVRSRATAKDVAQLADVSISTVHISMRNDPRVKEVTKQRVLAAAKQLNYRPVASARSLKQGRTQMIGGVFNHPMDIFCGKASTDPGSVEDHFIRCYVTALRVITYQLVSHGYHFCMLPPPTSTADGSSPIVSRLFTESYLDGFILIGMPRAGLENILVNQASPFVMLDGPGSDDCFGVTVDACKAAELGVKHLVELGHRRIANLTAVPATEPQVLRVWEFLRGYVRGMAAASLPPIKGWDEHLRLSEQIERLWQRPEPPTALVVYDDMDARKIGTHLAARGLRVPEDVSVVVLLNNMAGDRTAHCSMPPLTSIDLMTQQMGAIATDTLLQILEQGGGTPKSVKLEPQLVVGQSTARCRD